MRARPDSYVPVNRGVNATEAWKQGLLYHVSSKGSDCRTIFTLASLPLFFVFCFFSAGTVHNYVGLQSVADYKR